MTDGKNQKEEIKAIYWLLSLFNLPSELYESHERNNMRFTDEENVPKTLVINLKDGRKAVFYSKPYIIQRRLLGIIKRRKRVAGSEGRLYTREEWQAVSNPPYIIGERCGPPFPSVSFFYWEFRTPDDIPRRELKGWFRE